MVRAEVTAGLAGCHGYAVAARDGWIGSVETPVFPAAGVVPDYLLVRTSSRIPGTFRIVPAPLVRTLDASSKTLALALDAAAVAALPERLPAATARRRALAAPDRAHGSGREEGRV